MITANDIALSLHYLKILKEAPDVKIDRYGDFIALMAIFAYHLEQIKVEVKDE